MVVDAPKEQDLSETLRHTDRTAEAPLESARAPRCCRATDGENPLGAKLSGSVTEGAVLQAFAVSCSLLKAGIF